MHADEEGVPPPETLRRVDPPAAAAPPARTKAVSGRSRRCANHPGAATAGTCQVCGRPLCIACAVLVRGGLVGSECLSAVLEDAPLPDTEPAPAPTKGDRLAIAGFGFVLLLSLFPWSRFSGSGFFGAWTLHWSLVAVAAAAAGLAFALVARRRWSDPRLVAPIYALLGMVVAGGAFLAHRRPPPLAEPSAATWLAIIGAALVLIGAGRKIVIALRTRYPAS